MGSYKSELGYSFFTAFFCSSLLAMCCGGAPAAAAAAAAAAAGTTTTTTTTTSSSGSNNITVAVMLPDNYQQYPWAMARVFPALLMAREDLRPKYGLLPGRSVHIVNFSTEDPATGLCAESKAQVEAVDAKMYAHPDAFFGPGCVYPLASVGRFASHWKLPLITAGGPAYGFDKRHDYRTTVRAGPSTTKLGDFAAALHAHFNWTARAVVVYYDLREDDSSYSQKHVKIADLQAQNASHCDAF